MQVPSEKAQYGTSICIGAIVGILGLAATCGSGWHIGAFGAGNANSLPEQFALVIGWGFGVILSAGVALGAAVAVVAFVLFSVAGLRILTTKKRKMFKR